MNHHKLSSRSMDRLQGVNPTLCRVVIRALKLSPIDFGVSEGLRDKERQQYLFDTGKSKTLNSRHIIGEAVDLFAYIDGKASWAIGDYALINKAMQQAAKELGVTVTWGGNWVSFVDGPHWQIEVSK